MKSLRAHLLLRSLLCALALAALASCDDSDTKITVYRAPKEAPVAAKAQAAGPGEAALHWTAPSEWEAQPASGFRKGSFVVRGADGTTADVSVISFPEAAGGVLANVNRWREQLKLAPITDEAEAGKSFPVAGHEMLAIEIASEHPIAPETTNSRILGGIFPLHGETWFFKMIGPDELVASQRAAFTEFLQSVHLADPNSAHSHAPSSAAGQSTNAPTPPPLESTTGAPLQYTLPANWREKPLTPMRAASFGAAAPNGKEIDVSVVTLGGMAGGDLANVNRWRDQVKLLPIDEATLRQTAEHIQADGRDFLVVDMVSDGAMGDANEKQRIIAAILDEKGRSWFIKMTGEDAAVASQKNAFADFLRSLKLH